MPLKFTQIDWATGSDFLNPFESLVSRLGQLRGLARKVLIQPSDLLVHVRFDQEGEFTVGDLLCVVIGRDKVVAAGATDVKHHVLVIQQAPKVDSMSGEELYERVGVASLRPEQVGEQGLWVNIV